MKGKFENYKGVMKRRKSKKDRQCNGQNKWDKKGQIMAKKHYIVN